MVKASIDLRKVHQQLKTLTKDLNKTAEEVITEVAQIGARQLAMKIEPFGMTGSAQKVAEGAVLKDTMKAYHFTGQTYNMIKKVKPNMAHAYAAAIRKNDLKKAELLARSVIAGIEVNQTDSGEYLESKRTRKGRVPDNATSMNLVSDAALERIRAMKILTAGTAKKGFLMAGKSLGSKTRIPKWLRSNDVLGSSTKKFNGAVKVVTLHNHVKYVSSLLTGNKEDAAVAYAFRNQRARMMKQLQAITAKFSST